MIVTVATLTGVPGSSFAASAPSLDRPWRRPGALRYSLGRVRRIIRPAVTVTEPPDDVVCDWDLAVPVRDGTVLRANVFRPPDQERAPAVLSIHPYGKDRLPARRGRGWTFPFQYRISRQPDPIRFSAWTGWEAPDPAWWVKQGFAVVNADLRGCGHSEGTAEMFSGQESNDAYDVIEWIAAQPWCDGRVVMLGVSYLAVSQYGTAALHPPALRAICPWEGFTDMYRDTAFPGGIRERGFIRNWGLVMRRTTRQAYDVMRVQKAHPLHDQFWGSLVPDLSAITVPMLVCGSFSDQNLHSTGSMRAFTDVASPHARLYTHRSGKWSTFYSEPARDEQLAFLRGVLDGTTAPTRTVRLEVREDCDTIAAVREETEWPLARTQWQPLYLAGPGLLGTAAPSDPGSITFHTRRHAAAFGWTVPEDLELSGPMAARLWLEVQGGDDVNLFVGVEKWRDGRYVGFEGSFGYGRDRVATGWQKASLRELDEQRSTRWQPVPALTNPRRLRPGEVVAVDIALGPSATVFRAGEQLRFVVAGRWLSPRNPLSGQFPAAFPHPPRGNVTLHWGPGRDAHLLIPQIPAPNAAGDRNAGLLKPSR